MRWRLSVAGAALLATLAGAPAVAATSPAVNEPPMTSWVWAGPPQFPEPEVVFNFSGSFVPFPFPAGNQNGAPSQGYATIDQGWGGFDNPAPLLWYAQHVNATWLGQSMFPAGVKYSPQLIAAMNAEHFAPSMVGGVNPPGITTSSTAPSPAPAPAPSPSPAPSAPSSSGSTGSGGGSSTSATASNPAPSHTSAGSSSAGGTAAPRPASGSAPTGSGSSAPAPASGSNTAPASGSSATPGKPAWPAAATQGPSLGQYRRTIQADAARLHHQAAPTRPSVPWWPWVAAGAAIVAGGGGGLVWWRRRQPVA